MVYFCVGGDHGSKYRVDVIAPGRQDIILFSGAPTSVWHRPTRYIAELRRQVALVTTGHLIFSGFSLVLCGD